jgi:hypothetical protein
MIEIDRDPDSDEIVNIRLGGERLKSDDGETWFLPKGLIAPDMLVNELPEQATFELCERIENDTIMMDSIPIRLTTFIEQLLQSPRSPVQQPREALSRPG